MNTSMICVTIISCVFIICYYINKLANNGMEHEELINSMFNDIAEINDIIDRTSDIEIYNDTIKHNLLTIKYIISKYVEEAKYIDTKTKKS